MAEERRKERMRETGDEVEGRTMEEESALLVTGRKALTPKSFWFYSQENKCNFKRNWLRYIGGHQRYISGHPSSSTITGSARLGFLRLSDLSGLAGRR